MFDDYFVHQTQNMTWIFVLKNFLQIQQKGHELDVIVVKKNLELVVGSGGHLLK